jgi:hypothetical protein
MDNSYTYSTAIPNGRDTGSDWQNISAPTGIMLVIVICLTLIGLITFISFVRMMQDVREIRKILEKQTNTKSVESTIKIDNAKSE